MEKSDDAQPCEYLFSKVIQTDPSKITFPLMLALDNELVFLAHVPRAEELLVVLAVKQRRLVPIQSICQRKLTKKQF